MCLGSVSYLPALRLTLAFSGADLLHFLHWLWWEPRHQNHNITSIRWLRGEMHPRHHIITFFIFHIIHPKCVALGGCFDYIHSDSFLGTIYILHTFLVMFVVLLQPFDQACFQTQLLADDWAAMQGKMHRGRWINLCIFLKFFHLPWPCYEQHWGLILAGGLQTS